MKAPPLLQTYGTPQALVDQVARDSFGRTFALDVCAEPWSAKAPRFYAQADDGRVQNWKRDAAGGPAWMNPPYRTQEEWLALAARWAEKGVHTAALVLASTSASYWRPLVWERATCDLFEGRIAHIDPVSRKPMSGFDRASALVLFGPRFTAGVVRVRSAQTFQLVHTVGARGRRTFAA